MFSFVFFNIISALTVDDCNIEALIMYSEDDIAHILWQTHAHTLGSNRYHECAGKRMVENGGEYEATYHVASLAIHDNILHLVRGRSHIG